MHTDSSLDTNIKTHGHTLRHTQYTHPVQLCVPVISVIGEVETGELYSSLARYPGG